LDPVEQSSTREYLFSACIPSAFNKLDILGVCKTVADGNDFIDYLESSGDSESQVIH